MFKQGNLRLKGARWSIGFFSIPIFFLFLLTTGIFIATRLYNLTAYSLWGGETFSLEGARLPWGDMFSYVIADIVHPPMFYILLKIWVAIGGESLLWLKLLPTLIGIATFIPFLLLCQELKLKPIELVLALIFVSVNGYLIHYAQELRMYIPFMFLSAWSYWLFLKFFNAESNIKKPLLALFVTNLLLIYTHYYGWIVVGMQFLFLALFKRQRLLAFSISAAGLAILFSPWAYFIVRETIGKGGLDSNLDWIPRPELYNLRHFYSNLNGLLGFRRSMELGIVIFGFPILLWAWRTIRSARQEGKEDQIAFWFLFLLAFVPVVFIYAASQILAQAVWTDRYFIFIAIPYLILVAMSVQRLRPDWLRTGTILILVIWSVQAGVRDLTTNRMAWEGVQLGSRIEWESLARDLTEAETLQDANIKVYVLPVISNRMRTGDWAFMTSMDFYLNAHHDNRFHFQYARDASTVLSIAEEDHFWVAFYDLAGSPSGLAPKKVLANNGFDVGEEIQRRQGHNRLVMFPVWR